MNQVHYEEDYYDDQKVSISRIVTSPKVSIVPMESFEILIGNTDRHWGNWGFFVDNRTNMPIRLHDLMDFNKAFQSYDTLDGARCLTCDKLMSQKEAAIA